ncbi:hypothetical protein [Spelaeicoccus albus]|uniref:Uncharacterized protein n=1 Tax=Spelaeicoccus albus TaxID=1280376 RepID=A0A7Z0A8E7_9MICO|nr:hypothetical protein [Spelaeicoccus albus]NYI66257.1 hypothetical protein [Spelaeicoccus albus]
MRSPRFGQLRYLRAAVFAAVIILVGTTAHVAGGGRLPSFVHGSIIFVLVLWACVVLTRWRLPLPAVLAMLGFGELALHEALMISPGTMAGPMGAGAMGTGAMAGMHGADLPATAMQAASMNAGLSHPLSMIVFHVIATAVTALALSHGEDAVWRLWAWLTARVVRTYPFRLSPRSVLRARVQFGTPTLCPILSVAPLRGPPRRQFA